MPSTYRLKMNDLENLEVHLKFYIVPKAPGTNYINKAYLEKQVGNQHQKSKTTNEIAESL